MGSHDFDFGIHLILFVNFSCSFLTNLGKVGQRWTKVACSGQMPVLTFKNAKEFSPHKEAIIRMEYLSYLKMQ